jgi:5-methylcytosine-specific restriction protein A
MIQAIREMIFGAAKSKIESSPPRDSLRSPKWDGVRKKHLLTQPTCQACGKSKNVSVHHIEPFHLRPDLELDPSNLLSLCEDGPNCHLTWGHLRDWKQYNPHVVKDAALYLSRIKQYRINR